MAAWQDSSVRQESASAVLRDVFALTGRGTIAVVANIEGTIKLGNTSALPTGPALISGVEMIRFTDPTKRPRDSIGLLLDGVDVDAVRPLIGTQFTFKKGPH